MRVFSGEAGSSSLLYSKTALWICGKLFCGRNISGMNDIFT